MLNKLPKPIGDFILNGMEPDDRIKLLEGVPEDLQQSILDALSPEERKITKQLLSYKEDSVGRLMTPYFVSIRENKTVRSALDQIRWSDFIPTEYLSQIYVIDDDGELVGYLELAKIVLADPRTIKIRNLMDNLDVVLNPEQDESDAVEAFRRYDCNYIPVVDGKNHMIGLVTSDDVFDVAEEDVIEDIQ